MCNTISATIFSNLCQVHRFYIDEQSAYMLYSLLILFVFAVSTYFRNKRIRDLESMLNSTRLLVDHYKYIVEGKGRY